jgi:hypothetical protein
MILGRKSSHQTCFTNADLLINDTPELTGVLIFAESTPSPSDPNSSSWIDHSRHNNTARNLDMLINDSPTAAPIVDGCRHQHARCAPHNKERIAMNEAREAGITAQKNLVDGVVAIDKFFGQGFAREHPVLIGAFMQATATVYAGEIIVRQIMAGSDGIAKALHAANINSDLGAIDENVRAASTLQAKGFDGISGALRELVEATQDIAAICQQMPKRYE